jgi:hypothetical protein
MFPPGIYTSFSASPIAITHTPTNPFNSYISTQDTINLMRQIILTQSKSPFIFHLVSLATSDLPTNANDRDIVRSLFNFVKSNVKFEEDEAILLSRLGIDPSEDGGRELLISPDVLFTMNPPSGDCDDFSLLLATLLTNLKFKVEAVTICCDPIEPNRFSHIYLRAFLEDEGKWIALDSSHGSSPGWEFNNGIIDGKKCFKKVQWFLN